MSQVKEEVVEAVLQWVYQLGIPGLILILSFYFVGKLFKNLWFIELLKYKFNSKNREIKQIDDSLALFKVDDPLKEMFEKDKRMLVFSRRYGYRLANDELDYVAELMGKVGNRFQAFKIAKIVKYFSRDNSGKIYIRDFDLSDKIEFWFIKIFSIAAIAFAAAFFLAVYITMIMPELQLVSEKLNGYKLVQVFLLCAACTAMVVGSLIFASTTWPYLYAREIKAYLKKCDAESKVNEAESLPDKEAA